MTRPDARMLVPVSALPGGRAPAGATVWDGNREGIVCGHGRHVTAGPTVYVAWMEWPRTTVPASSVDLDLSRPDVVDGVPVRLDALGWALGVLAKGASHADWESYTKTLIVMRDDVVCCYIVSADYGITSEHAPVVRLVDWPDLTGLLDDDAARAVVAAALRGGA